MARKCESKRKYDGNTSMQRSIVVQRRSDSASTNSRVLEGEEDFWRSPSSRTETPLIERALMPCLSAIVASKRSDFEQFDKTRSRWIVSDRPFSTNIVHPVVFPASGKLFFGRCAVFEPLMGGRFQKSAAGFRLAVPKIIVEISPAPTRVSVLPI